MQTIERAELNDSERGWVASAIRQHGQPRSVGQLRGWLMGMAAMAVHRLELEQLCQKLHDYDNMAAVLGVQR